MTTEHSRRDFLIATSAASTGLMLFGCRPPRSDGTSRELAYALFFDAGDLDVLRARYRNNPFFVSLREAIEGIDRESERRFIAEEVRYNDHLFDIVRLSETAENMAFHYLMTGDEDAADLAREAIRAIMKFPKWDYFLEGGTRTIGVQRASSTLQAVCLAADWLGDFVPVSERRAWIEAVREKGNEACYLFLYGLRHKDRVEGWSLDTTSTYLEHRPGQTVDMSNWPTILDRTNLKAVPAGTLALGAATYQSEFGAGDDSERWLEQSEFSLRTFDALYADDGSYDEGVTYANYTTSNILKAVEVLDRKTDRRVHDVINWEGHADYLLQTSMPTKDRSHWLINFGDVGDPISGLAGARSRSAVPFWIAGRYGSSGAKWFGENLAAGANIWSVIWYPDAVATAAPEQTPVLWRSGLDWMVFRTGFDADDLLVAMRSGGPSNHEHADRNSIIVKAFGQELIVDPYRAPYSHTDPSWMMRTTAGHSAVLVDGQGHQYHDGSEGTNASNAVARIVKTVDETDLKGWTSDATPAYSMVNPDIDGISRTVLNLPGLSAVIILDSLNKKVSPSSLEARFFTRNDDGQANVEATASGFTISRPGARVTATVLSAGSWSSSSGSLPIPDEEARKHPFVAVRTKEKRTNHRLATVLSVDRSGDKPIVVEGKAGNDSIEILLRRGDRRATVLIDTREANPTYRIA